MSVKVAKKMSYLIDNRRNFNGRPSSKLMRAEVMRYLPRDLQSKVTVIVQASGYATILPTRFTRRDWVRLNESVVRMGGLWFSNSRFSHWSIPLSRTN